MGVDSSAWSDFELVDEFEKAAVCEALHLSWFHQVPHGCRPVVFHNWLNERAITDVHVDTPWSWVRIHSFAFSAKANGTPTANPCLHFVPCSAYAALASLPVPRSWPE